MIESPDYVDEHKVPIISLYGEFRYPTDDMMQQFDVLLFDLQDLGCRIYTYVTFEVERFLKGGAGEREITIRLWGGQVGGFTSLVPGTPQFVEGEEVLLFCSGSRARVPTILGLSLGKFTITRDAAGEKILKRDISGLVLKNYRTDSRPLGAPPTRYRLSDVEARIQAALVN